MTRTRGPLFSLDATGALARSIVFQRSATGHYIRPYKVPRRNTSQGQLTTQILSRYLTKRWPRLSPADQATWIDTAAAHHTTPWGAYLRHNHARWLAGNFPTDTYPAAETGTALSVLPRDQLVTVSPTTAFYPGTANAWSTNQLYQFLHDYNFERIRQTCSLKQVQLTVTQKPANVTHFYLEIWRWDGSKFDLVNRQDIWSAISVGNPCTVTLPTPIAVQEGDYVGYQYTASSSQSLFLHYAVTPDANPCRYKQSSPMPDVDADWDAQSRLWNRISLHLYATAPWLVCAGDSLTAGGPAHSSLWTWPNSGSRDMATAQAFPPQLAALLGVESQNCGYTSRTSAQVLSAWAAEVTAQHPQLACLLVGVNDIATSVSQSTYLANVQSIIDAAAADGTAVALVSILPWTNGSNAQLTTRDTWNVQLAAKAAANSNAIYLDVADELGQFRAGGPAGNKWDILSTYNADGVHLNAAGYTALAAALHRKLVATQYGAAVPTNADAPTSWLLGLRVYDDDIAGFSIHRSTAPITALSRLNCLAIADATDPAAGQYTFTDRPATPGTYHYRAAAFSKSGKALYYTPNHEVIVP